MKDTLGVLLAGGAGERLYPLTRDRAKPAVPVGGKFRLIDIPISNSLHAGIDRIFVVTQYNSASLNSHITRSYLFDRFRGGFVTVLAAEQEGLPASVSQASTSGSRRRHSERGRKWRKPGPNAAKLAAATGFASSSCHAITLTFAIRRPCFTIAARARSIPACRSSSG